jgi:hypothetical protein
MTYLRQDKVNHSSFSKRRRRYQSEKPNPVKPEETLVPVSISHAKCNNVIQTASRLTVIFPNGVKVYVPVGMESSAVKLITSYSYSHVLPK